VNPLTGPLRDGLRNLLRIRRPRTLPPRSPRPGVGARIFCDDVRITVQAGMTDELWRWLMERGWREVFYRPDRRVYRDVPSSIVTQLIDAAPEDRDAVLARARREARVRAPRTLDR
jgi:hypothetical protein